MTELDMLRDSIRAQIRRYERDIRTIEDYVPRTLLNTQTIATYEKCIVKLEEELEGIE